jgi:CRISPR type III-B/RAMP module-associated protein Cmr5
MNNLEQERAKHALAEAPNLEKKSVAKLPSMIICNGLLGTLAFACEDKDNRKGMAAAADSLARHLSNSLPEIGAARSGTELCVKLAGMSNQTLQRATAEALAYLSYLKRFAEKKPDNS